MSSRRSPNFACGFESDEFLGGAFANLTVELVIASPGSCVARARWKRDRVQPAASAAADAHDGATQRSALRIAKLELDAPEVHVGEA